MKKLSIAMIAVTSLFIAGTMSVSAALVWQVQHSGQKFIVNGKETPLSALNINGHNYLKLEDMAELFDTTLSYDADTNTVYIDQMHSNTTEPGISYGSGGANNFGSGDENTAQRIINTIDVAVMDSLEYIVLGTYNLEEGDVINYNITYSGEGNLSMGFVKEGVDPENTNERYFVTFDPGSNFVDTATEPITKNLAGSYTLFACNVSDQPIADVKGAVIIEKNK